MSDQYLATVESFKRETFDSKNAEKHKFDAGEGITEEVVKEISRQKDEPEWMRKFRLEALAKFHELPTPKWGPDLSKLDLNKIRYFIRPDSVENARKWMDLPEDIRRTFEKLGIPEAERTALAGAGAQYESAAVYHNLKKQWEDKGVIFTDCDLAIKEHPKLFKDHFMNTCVPVGLHKFTALHGAVWSGGSFIYVPEGVKIDMPLQAYFRMNAVKGGQFEHTLIIADKDSQIFYIEGCSAPIYSQNSLHAGCVELHVKEGARMRYSSVENWSKNTYNLNTKRAVVDKNATVEWIGGNMGCLTGDTKIFANPCGVMDIEDAAAGESVFAADTESMTLNKKPIKGAVCNGVKDVYELTAAGRAIKATGNHPFLVLERETIKGNKRKGKFATKWKPLEDIKEGDIVAISKEIPEYGESHKLPKIDISNRKIKNRNQYQASFEMSSSYKYKKIKLPEETSDDLMWLFGLYVGDGSIWKIGNKAKTNIALPVTDNIRKIAIGKIKQIFDCEAKERDERSIVVDSGILAEFIDKCGFSGRANEKRIPKWVYSLPLSQRLSFLGGYLDSDGHVEGGNVYFTSCNKNLLEDIKLLSLSCGMGVSRIFNHRKGGKINIIGNECNSLDSFRLLLTGENLIKIKTRREKIKSKLAINKTKRRNYSTAKGLNFSSMVSDQIGFAKVDSKTYVGKEPVYDIEVEDAHNFVANGFIVHNSGVTMLYPCSILRGENSHADHIGIAFAGKEQNQDVGAKVYQIGKNTSCVIKSKSISKDGGITSYRGLLQIAKGATGAKASVNCDALMMDAISKSNTYPYMKINENKVDIAHEATVGKISSDQIFYLMSRGIPEEQAVQMIVSGFIEPIVKELPLEYAVELNRLIQLEMEGSIG